MPDSPLDDWDEIRKIDKNNMLSFQVKAARHFDQASKTVEKVSVNYPSPRNVIIAGMGGSAIGGEIIKDWARSSAASPIEICRDYDLPKYADTETLVLVSSYSGETEESLSSFLDARKRGAMICCFSSGGKLLEFAEKFDVPFVRVPGGMPPRAALPYLLIPMFQVLEKTGFVSGFSREFLEAKRILKNVAKDNSPENALKNNPAKALAVGINKTVPVVYGFGIYRSVAQRMKQQFNENSKVPSKWEFFPELDHNEIVGWEKAGDVTKRFSSIFLRDKNETKEVRSRIEITKAIMEPAVSKQFDLWGQGKNDLSKMLSIILMGDFTSVYLAVLRKVDPTPVDTISTLKKKLDEVGTKARIIRGLEKLVQTQA